MEFARRSKTKRESPSAVAVDKWVAEFASAAEVARSEEAVVAAVSAVDRRWEPKERRPPVCFPPFPPMYLRQLRPPPEPCPMLFHREGGA